jgi:opacity protein-like surface antigen
MKKLFVTILILFSISTFTNAQRNPMSVGASATFSIPMGDFNDIATMGFGLKGNFIYGVSRKFEVTGSIGFISWGRDIPTITEVLKAEADGSFTSIPVMVGARLYFPQRELMPYATIELGLHIFGISDYTLTISDVKTKYKGSTNVDFGFGFGGGAVYEITDGFKVDGNLKYNIINEESSIAHLTMELGFLFGIN